MNTFEQDLQQAVAYHGHLCSGQILGVRIARLAAARLGVEDPRANRDIIAIVECDRCIADAVSSVTGCTLGRRRLKFMDYGKMAATLIDVHTGQGVRVHCIGKKHAPKGGDLVAFYQAIPDEALFAVQAVQVPLRPEDLPGPPISRVICARCGEDILDNRQVAQGGANPVPRLRPGNVLHHPVGTLAKWPQWLHRQGSLHVFVCIHDFLIF